MAASLYPSLYQLPARTWLEELGRGSGRCATLDQVPSSMLDKLAEQGFQWLWLMGVWQTGEAGRRISRSNQEELLVIAERCDSVSCDMAMLLLPRVMERTWGETSRPKDGSPPVDAPFWPEAIGMVKNDRPDFVFLAEVYWDLEWTLMQQG